MSLFSLPGVLRRSSIPSDGSDNAPAVRPSVVSASSLNEQLLEETKHVDQHLFFGPQQTVFEGERLRVIHGNRKIQKNNKCFWLTSEPLSMDRDSTTSLIGFPVEPQVRPGGLGNKMSAATRFISQKVSQMKLLPSHVNADSFCDGCGMDPIVGNMYSCSKCVNYHLCESCYQLGIHGFEDSKLLQEMREDFALRKVMDGSKNKVPEEVFTVLFRTVCRGQLDKFNFVAKWITAVVLGQPINTFDVRGIEIPHLDTETRATLVQLLTPVLADRTDLEVCMEWFCPDADNMELPGVQRRMETIRIWVATDKDQKSPFASKEDKMDGEAVSEVLSSNEHKDSISTAPSSPIQNPTFTSVVSTTSESSSQISPGCVDAQIPNNGTESIEEDNNIAPRKVDSLSSCGQRSEGIEI